MGWTKTGHTFLGWSENSGATEAEYTVGSKLMYRVDKDLTLYAVWKANTYNIVYDANTISSNQTALYGNVEGSTSSTPATYGQKVTVADNGFSITGYDFLGWDTNKNATAPTYTAENKTFV